ncbi:MAG: class I SAM-dependent methyltransferase [Ferruginibacter sp.]
MNHLYNSLAGVYEAMYKSFIDYPAEFELYKDVLLKNNCNSVVEIGCGTGNLAGLFIKNKFDYTGLDISAEMLAIAKRNIPGGNFLQAGMQDFQLPHLVDASIITGRSISYLLTNKDVTASFACIAKNLLPAGIICFDFIDANKFIPLIKKDAVWHTASVNKKTFKRESFWSLNASNGWSFDWRSVFYEESPDGSLLRIGEDQSTIRAFTKDEIILFLQLCGFRATHIYPRLTYAFDTFMVVAEKLPAK